MKNTLKTAPRPDSRRVELGRYLVADPDVCSGKPTFKGTRIMVQQVLADVAEGRSWEFICNTRWGGKIPLAAVAEAARLAGEAWMQLHGGNARRQSKKETQLAAA